MSYDRTVALRTTFEEAVAAVRAALAEQGFGVLTEIDVQAVLKAKLGHDMEPYLILGACSPPLAQRALDVDRSIGLLLPCNVVVRADGKADGKAAGGGEGAGVVVQAVDPEVLVSLTGLEAMTPVAEEATRRLDAALGSLAGAV